MSAVFDSLMQEKHSEESGVFWYNSCNGIEWPGGALTPPAVTQESEAPMSEQYIACSRCKKFLPRSAYDRRINHGRYKGYYPTCRDCRVFSQPRHVIPNPDDPSGATVLLPLTRGMFAVIDAEDAERTQQYKWAAFCTGKNGRWYARCHVPGSGNGGSKGHQWLLHRFLLGVVGDDLVDHRNGDGLDCRKSNLRQATTMTNQHNMKRQHRHSSGFKGVSWNQTAPKWVARIRSNGVTHYLGLFVKAEDAALAYDDAARRLHGDFARLNFPNEGEEQA